MPAPLIQFHPDHAKAYVSDKFKDKFPIQQVFQDYWDAYAKTHFVPDYVSKAVSAMMRCKTGELGYTISYCPDCETPYYQPISCNNRSCPCCQSQNQTAWAEARKSEIIDGVCYYHYVQTTPHRINPLFKACPQVMCSIYFDSVKTGIMEYAQNPDCLGATPSVLSVLQSWDQRLNPHWHIHSLISGAGLTDGPDKKLITIQDVRMAQHKPPLQNGQVPFFISERALSNRIKYIFVEKLRKAYDDGSLVLPDSLDELRDRDNWHFFTEKLIRDKWVGHIEGSASGQTHVVDYLARYIHRTAVTNSRVQYDGTTVVLTFKKRAKVAGQRDKSDSESMSPLEFISRFIYHILPPRLCRVRSFGITANSCKSKNLSLAFSLVGKVYTPSQLAHSGIAALMNFLYPDSFNRCPKCSAKMILVGRFKADFEPFSRRINGHHKTAA